MGEWIGARNKQIFQEPTSDLQINLAVLDRHFIEEIVLSMILNPQPSKDPALMSTASKACLLIGFHLI